MADDQKTHKNVALRLQSPVPYKAATPKAPKAAPKPAAVLTKPPKFELDGKKWLVVRRGQPPPTTGLIKGWGVPDLGRCVCVCVGGGN